MYRWFFDIGVVVLAALFADRMPRGFRWTAIAIVSVLLITTIAEIAAGALRLQAMGGRGIDEFHRWTAHAIVIAHWILIFAAVGGAIAVAARQRWFLVVAMVVLPAAAFGLSLMVSMTGYLDRYSEKATSELELQIREETHNRFVVLHAFALPLLLTASQSAMLVAAWALPRRRMVSSELEHPASEPS